MKKLLVVLFCAAVLTTGLFTGETVNNCEKFDKDIQYALSQYGPIGVDVNLLRASGHPIPIAPGFCCEVTLWVSPVVAHPRPEYVTWHFCGGLIYHTIGGPILGIRGMDRTQVKKLIGCCKAASKLPKSFPVNKATISLYWVLYPGCDEPFYSFVFENQNYRVGGFTGKLY